METIDIDIWSADNPSTYNIFIDDGAIDKIDDLVRMEKYSMVGVLTDQAVASLWLDRLEKAAEADLYPVVIPFGEEHKNLDTVKTVWEKLQRAGFDRKSLLLNLGGGVVGDLGGFVASTYMRGIDFVQIPTTLLSQVDASVGGKVGVNFGEVKNLIGAFSQPQAVVIDVKTLTTLPKREILSGFIEVIKHGLIRDADYLLEVSKKANLKLESKDYVKIVKHSCKIKADTVEEDFKEGGIRKILNFGHTIGHAVETLSHLNAEEFVTLNSQEKPYLLHGEAVGLGIIVEAVISQKIGYLREDELARTIETIGKFGLPVRLDFHASPEEIMNKVRHDKKNVSGKINWTLLKGIGNAVYDIEVEEETVLKAIEAIL